MKYEALIYKNTNGEEITFGVGNLYHVNVGKDVTGLSGVDSTVYSASSIGQHGDTYTGVRVEPRKIKITGRIRAPGDKNAQVTARRKLMRVFNPELAGTLTYVFGKYERSIPAILEGMPEYKREDDVYPKFKIELKCLSPFWVEQSDEHLDIATWDEKWVFPWVIDDGFEFATKEASQVASVLNKGDVSVGATFVLTATGAAVNPQIFNADTREFLKINYTLQTGDVLTMCTEYGNKVIRLHRNGEMIDLYRELDVDSSFFQLAVGENNIQYDADSGADNLDVKVQYKQKYVGV